MLPTLDSERAPTWSPTNWLLTALHSSNVIADTVFSREHARGCDLAAQLRRQQ